MGAATRPMAVGWTVGAVLLAILCNPAGMEAQAASSGGTERAGGGSFGRISGGGGSYGTLTLGVTAEDVGPRHRARLRERPRTTVPLGPFLYPSRVVRAPYPADATGGENSREASRRVPPTEPPARAVRRSEVVRALKASGVESRSGDRVEGKAGGGDARSERMAPRVRPPVPPSDGEALPLEECAEVRVTAAGGIQWRLRVPVSEYGADTPGELATGLHEALDRGRPLSLRGPDGSFGVPASLVDGLIVGPCQGS